MRVAVLAVHDKKAELFSQPMFFQAIGQGVRAFADAVNDGKSGYAKHPEDYTLFQVAWFDDVKGEFEPLNPVVSLGVAVSFVTSDPRQLSLLKAEA